MTEKLEELFVLLDEINDKVRWITEHEPEHRAEKPFYASKRDYLNHLLEHLKEERGVLTEMFKLSSQSALVLAVLLRLHIKSDCMKRQFIHYVDIEKALGLYMETRFVFVLRESLFDLEERNIIEIRETGHYLVRILNPSGTSPNDYYLLPAKPSFVPFANSTFEFTGSFIHHLNSF
ncbi:hypothetical protein [Kaistella sp.]|uniref:hypothetical protein n=1 Tax=Kaistella sp. TaxID=2782235 RepID=UPI002F95888E